MIKIEFKKTLASYFHMVSINNIVLGYSLTFYLKFVFAQKKYISTFFNLLLSQNLSQLALTLSILKSILL